MRVHKFEYEKRVGDWVAANTLGSRVVVDFGAGDFNYIYAADAQKRIGIEIHKPYVDEAISHNPPGLQIFLGDMRQYDEFIDPNDCDCAMMIDTLEHLPREDGDVLLPKMQESFRKILVFTPCGEHAQGPIDNNPYQEHKSTWFPSDLEGLGFSVVVENGFHSPWKTPESNTAAMYAVWEDCHDRCVA